MSTNMLESVSFIWARKKCVSNVISGGVYLGINKCILNVISVEMG